MTPLMNRNILFLLAFICAMSESLAQKYATALSPEESMKKLQVAEGFSVELFASEPHVFDPVALEFDAQGDAYVL